MRGRYVVAAVLWAVVVGIPIAPSAEPIRAEGLPGYYEFFMKAGKLTRIAQEEARDERISAGELAPVRVRKPLPDVALPLPSGEQLSLRSYVGKRNLVLVSFRSWW